MKFSRYLLSNSTFSAYSIRAASNTLSHSYIRLSIEALEEDEIVVRMRKYRLDLEERIKNGQKKNR